MNFTRHKEMDLAKICIGKMVYYFVCWSENKSQRHTLWLYGTTVTKLAFGKRT